MLRCRLLGHVWDWDKGPVNDVGIVKCKRCDETSLWHVTGVFTPFFRIKRYRLRHGIYESINGTEYEAT